jgi:hypothetical protein
LLVSAGMLLGVVGAAGGGRVDPPEPRT